jgi:hypothetical protein
VRVLALANTGAVVSSAAWMRSATKTCLAIVSTSGINMAALAPTQSASVEMSGSMPFLA